MKKLCLPLAAALTIAAAGLAHADGHANQGTMIALDQVEWRPIRPGSQVGLGVLWGDPSAGAHVRLVKLPAGFVVPVHAHTGAYHGVNLTGTWKHSFTATGEERILPPGSYVFQPGGEMHGDSCVGPEDCVLMLQQSVASDFIPQTSAE